jgi:carbon storage regulator
MLVLTRKPGESLIVGDAVVHFLESSHGRTRVGIAAPKEVLILRSELNGRKESNPTVLPDADASPLRRSGRIAE